MDNFLPLSREFFRQPTDKVAQQLLGKNIVRKLEGVILVGRIVETEAYFGVGDPAAHAAGFTNRTRILFGEAGYSYVFKLRGHHCFNVTTEDIGMPSAVLFRAVEPILGAQRMLGNRRMVALSRNLSNGPGKLCAALEISLSQYGVDLTDSQSEVYIADTGKNNLQVSESQRIGISKAVDRLLRFTVESDYLSR